MKLEEKKKVTEELARSFEESGTIYLTDFTGLSVEEMTEFRDRLAEEGVTYRVVKNTLALRALDDVDLPDIADHFRGPTGVVLGSDDPVAPAKVLTDFADEHDDRPTLKVGVVESRVVEPAEIEELAELPSREELLGGISGGLTASVAGIVGILDRIIGGVADVAHRAAQERESGDGE
ncbi:MAG: 50S ribosomal protein L10 [Gemmatimonadota bacterium]